MKVLDWGDIMVIEALNCANCGNGPMSQIGRMNLSKSLPERKGESVERRLVPGRDVLMMLCHNCGFVSLFDYHTLERTGKLQK